MAITSLSAGTTSLASRIGTVLANASMTGASAAAFLYTWYHEAPRESFLGVFRGQTDAELVNDPQYFSDVCLNHLTTGNITDAQHLIKQRHMIQTVLDERDVPAHGNALSVSEIQQMLADAQGT